MKLIIVRGWPGSGKSTFANAKFPGVLLLENDMFHMRDGQYMWRSKNMPDAVKWCSSMAETALANEMDVVVANTFTKCRYIDFYKKLAEKYNAKFEVWRCTGRFQNVHGLTDEMVKGFEKSMEDWPGEHMVPPHDECKMAWEVFDVSTNKVYGQFPDIFYADMFLNGLVDTDLAAQVQVRSSSC